MDQVSSPAEGLCIYLFQKPTKITYIIVIIIIIIKNIPNPLLHFKSNQVWSHLTAIQAFIHLFSSGALSNRKNNPSGQLHRTSQQTISIPTLAIPILSISWLHTPILDSKRIVLYIQSYIPSFFWRVARFPNDLAWYVLTVGWEWRGDCYSTVVCWWPGVHPTSVRPLPRSLPHLICILVSLHRIPVGVSGFWLPHPLVHSGKKKSKKNCVGGATRQGDHCLHDDSKKCSTPPLLSPHVALSGQSQGRCTCPLYSTRFLTMQALFVQDLSSQPKPCSLLVVDLDHVSPVSGGFKFDLFPCLYSTVNCWLL